jgi:1,4-dihydroxy-2-naphthoate octaprenyltransferase
VSLGVSSRVADDRVVVATNSGLKSWILALRPKTLTASVVPVLVATALVKAEGYPVLWWVSICAVLSACFIQIGTNFINDAIDFAKGADTETRTGPQRATQSGWLTSKQVMNGGFACFLIALVLGIPLVVHGGWPIVAIGLVSLALGYAYTGGPFPLAYVGLGDLFVILFFGLVAVMGTFFLHTGLVTVGATVAGLQVGCLATVLIAVNNMRDAPQDALVGKRTLAVRLGLQFSRFEIFFLIVFPYLLGVYWYNRGLTTAALLPFIAVPFARRVLAGVFTNEPGPLFNKFLAMSAGLQILFGILLAIALWVR